jgi:RsiW-degrading membrane proteinase PrsW (M82 family)
MAPVEDTANEGGHRLGVSALAEIMDPTTHWVMTAVIAVTLVVVVVVLIGFIRRGRSRQISLALTRMLSLLGPLLGICGVANNVMIIGIDAGNTNIAHPGIIGPFAALGAISMLIGAGAGCIGVILTAILRIDSARRAAKLGD